MFGMIYAESPEGVIGKDGTIPWRYPGDWRRFKRVTLGTVVIMGRTTFESIGKALPGRRNIVVTSRALDTAGVERAASLAEAMSLARSPSPVPTRLSSPAPTPSHDTVDVWFIGGARIYQEAMPYVDRIDVTYVPDHVNTEAAVFAPVIDETVFAAGPLLPHEDEPALSRRVYERRGNA